VKVVPFEELISVISSQGKECKNKQAYSAHKRGCTALQKNEGF
jgi:hypothetical protein